MGGVSYCHDTSRKKKQLASLKSPDSVGPHRSISLSHIDVHGSGDGGDNDDTDEVGDAFAVPTERTSGTMTVKANEIHSTSKLAFLWEMISFISSRYTTEMRTLPTTGDLLANIYKAGPGGAPTFLAASRMRDISINVSVDLKAAVESTGIGRAIGCVDRPLVALHPTAIQDGVRMPRKRDSKTRAIPADDDEV